MFYKTSYALKIIDIGANVNSFVTYKIVEECFQKSALIYAIEKKDISLILHLLEKGADINQDIKFEKSPFICAFETQNFDVIKIIIDIYSGAKTNNTYSKAPIIYALESKQLNLIEHVLSIGCSVNAYNAKTNVYSIDYAFEMHSDEIMKCLIDNHVDISKSTRFMNIEKEIFKGFHIDVIDSLIMNPNLNIYYDVSNYSFLPKYLCQCPEFAIKSLQQKFNCINAIDKHGYTAIYCAIKHFGSNLDKIKLLLDLGADPNRCRFKAFVAIDTANEELIKLLIQYKIYLTVRCTDNISVFEYSLRLESSKILKILIDSLTRKGIIFERFFPALMSQSDCFKIEVMHEFENQIFHKSILTIAIEMKKYNMIQNLLFFLYDRKFLDKCLVLWLKE
ncbi:hypothetical protein TVAG_441380 [Trichomonas vaginalis G3]|uniref:Uncharacterized protein n=1 Tax=Trichomonas vaginalis (strain ATCC PRA-98 / G3) TaxID=412133 RepID=A2FF94_TRIV3|nr:spectrin binding [Trichomonas vaginalis G3]EAX96424.1 hypothetical protein TVAG_441380 [Trichomonas vaginalis G3]KAI5501884.1 spectrin binding [Trichomonas vaginalis G3]|eukprot:XP_001309354.1 hypothetical protein [Trichomonas vaginalis G3]